ncbi:LacI family DNA-binding transcriptional regulator [Chelativorans alearense]|uniref:LacI family DNA-binding transcriptional regulator n=1 Tax=Chelativorans alearense TaxID=2681495 RepID=UPI0013D1772E|nr:LacI family DNA-binding transcriptional regulator [Chelativorans alearense]
MATIYDVARKAGVSPKTVSRVMNGDAPVNTETRKAVESAMGELAYVPSRAARTMRSNKTGLVGLITGAISTTPSSPESSGLPDLLIVQGILHVLTEAGITLLISDTGGDPAKVADLTRTFAQHRVEALIYVADYHRKVDLPAIARAETLILVNCFDDAGTPCVLPDDRRGQHALVARLIAAGHRRIGFLTLPEDLVAQGLRLQGYRDALAEAGLAYDPDLVAVAGLHNSGPREVTLIGDAIARMMALDEAPTVLCCGNDRMALQVYGILRSRGVAVPGDISVAGFDDYKLISETLYPPLTTAVLPYQAMGEKAAHMLLERLRANAPAEKENGPLPLISGPVVWRQSVTERNPSAQTG